jgi:hypothetical protein
MLTSYSILKISGAIGKKMVVKQYRKKTVITKYPDMSGVVPSEKQKVGRRLFARAVRYAQSIYRSPELKAGWRRRLRRPKRLFQALMKQYYKQIREKEERRNRRIRLWTRSVEANRGVLQRALFRHPVPALTLLHLEQRVSDTRELLKGNVYSKDPIPPCAISTYCHPKLRLYTG